MIKVLKASAGSGKTYRLSKTYIEMLMRSEDEFAYRHILAVTFTNKATDEMKSRIVRDLYELSRSGSASAPKAGRVLNNILHDYSAFSVCTIDRFFQKTLRSFAHELGNFSGYQVELDKAMLCEQAVAAILDSLDPEKADDAGMVDFIVDSMEERLRDGKKLDIEGELNAMAVALRSETFISKADAMGFDVAQAYSPEELIRLKKACHKVMDDFEVGIHTRCKAIAVACATVGMDFSDFSGGSSRSWIRPVFKYAQAPKPIPFAGVSESFMKRAGDSSQWLSKANAGKLAALERAVGCRLDDLAGFIGKGERLYGTATLLLGKIYGLGISARLSAAFKKILKENNVICLDESNMLLKRIIAGSDVPFVYEKAGTVFEHFLLDEFQDTSVTQWENFKPLLAESNSHDPGKGSVWNLIVGDIKQSIYRWRQSDWTLLAGEVQKTFPESDVEPMDLNWRSYQNIIDFNNEFYPRAAEVLDARTQGCSDIRISPIYADVRQKVARDDHKGRGYVEIRRKENADEQMEDVVAAVRQWHDEYKVPYGKMAVLVRTNDSATSVAEALVSADIPVVTEASLSLKNSLTVRRLVSLMSYVDNPGDTVGSFLANSLGVEYPDAWHSLSGLCDALYSQLHDRFKDACEADSMYVMSFVDFLMDYASCHGNDLHEFLRNWQDVNPTISSPLGSDAVNILSIHKSKGLDFDYVILPFVEKIKLYSNDTTCWAEPDVKGTALESVALGKLFYTKLTSSSEGTGFEKDYHSEVFNQSVDAINIMYVATTRAVRGMLILYSTRYNEGTILSFADILRDCCPQTRYGVMTEYSEESRKEKEFARSYGTLTVSYGIEPLKDRLTVRPYAREFFLEGESDDGLSRRQKGIVLHDILSRVVRPADLSASIDVAVADGSLGESSRQEVESFLRARIRSHPEIFPDIPAGAENSVLREVSFIGLDGMVHRPDRVLLRPDGSVLVVDYKFGAPRQEYREQIATYKAILEQMGYKKVEAELWFVYKNILH